MSFGWDSLQKVVGAVVLRLIQCSDFSDLYVSLEPARSISNDWHNRNKHYLRRNFCCATRFCIRRLSDIPDDIHYEQLVVGIREARAWLRGRYSHVPAANIDGVGIISRKPLHAHCLCKSSLFKRIVDPQAFSSHLGPERYNHWCRILCCITSGHPRRLWT